MASRLCLRPVLRPTPWILRFLPTRAMSAVAEPSRRRRQFGPPRPHEHSRQSEFLGSWRETPAMSDPREAQRRLDALRKEYARQVRECRKRYVQEMEELRMERVRKEEARKEVARLAKEEKKAAKKEADEARAARHTAFQEELRQILLKEKAEKLESWRAKEALMVAKKKERCELLRNQSSMWIDEGDLDKKILEAIVDTEHL